MDWLTFFAALAKALAWPAVVGVALWMFGDELVRLLRDATKLKVGTVEVERSVREATLQLSTVDPLENQGSGAAALTLPPIEPGPEIAPPALTTTSLLGIVREPVAAVITAWENIEKLVWWIAQRDDITVKDGSPTLDLLLGKLMQAGYYNLSTYGAITRLNEVRNQIAHGESRIDQTTAAEYVINADKVSALLQNTMRGRFR